MAKVLNPHHLVETYTSNAEYDVVNYDSLNVQMLLLWPLLNNSFYNEKVDCRKIQGLWLESGKRFWIETNLFSAKDNIFYKNPNKQYWYNFYVAFVTFFVISAICNTRVSRHDLGRYSECRSLFIIEYYCTCQWLCFEYTPLRFIIKKMFFSQADLEPANIEGNGVTKYGKSSFQKNSRTPC